MGAIHLWECLKRYGAGQIQRRACSMIALTSSTQQAHWGTTASQNTGTLVRQGLGGRRGLRRAGPCYLSGPWPHACAQSVKMHETVDLWLLYFTYTSVKWWKTQRPPDANDHINISWRGCDTCKNTHWWFQKWIIKTSVPLKLRNVSDSQCLASTGQVGCRLY